jgi:hypothetical protein
MAISTTSEARMPRKSAISTVTESVASKRCFNSSLDFSRAVSP